MIKTLIRVLSLIVLALIGVGAFYYAPPDTSETTTRFEGNIMTMDYAIIIGGKLATAERHKAKQNIDNIFREVNAIYNKWNPESELSRLNQMKAGEQKSISEELHRLLVLTDQIVTISEGRFDPTIEPVQQLWKKYLLEGKEPPAEELAAVSPAVGWDKIHFTKNSFTKDHDLTSIDLGGIAKGYAVDLLVESLHNAGFSNLLVEWGGEVRGLGQHPDKRNWTVVIAGFEETTIQNPLGQIELQDNAVATSGDYIQKWSVDNGTTYFHVIDPKHHRPLAVSAQSIASATVTANSCALADGLATAALSFDNIEEAENWTEQVQKRGIDAHFHLFSHR
jgi:thiamine biosynthesis lipoprotein